MFSVQFLPVSMRGTLEVSLHDVLQVSHGCAATAAAQELLTKLLLPCACVKKVSASVLFQAMKLSVFNPFEDLNNKIPLTILDLRVQKQLSFIHFSKSYYMR